jgi:cytochrome c-type biogenesis protein CcmH
VKSLPLVLVALVLVFATGAAPRASLPDIEDEVMCVECNTALNVSTSTVADQERAFIREQIALGKDKKQVKAALVAEYGPGVLADPPSSGFDLAAWLVPIVLVLIGIGGVVVAARRWRRQAAPEAAAAGEPLADEDARRLDAELDAYDRR